MTAWLIDTNVLSESIRPRPSPLVQAFLARETDLWLSVMTLHEIAYGAERSSDPVKKQQLLSWLGGHPRPVREKDIGCQLADGGNGGQAARNC